ncbi:MAG: sulfatase-like hydrolase/transferase [Opitutales bacterium]|jgi:arylsulfatase A|nr:sulfatase-like hydrolase/transferase [Opitutales bacterium]MDP4693912.1 sulfatase-like hydrolase/transferase [Opitutales bacterium]
MKLLPFILVSLALIPALQAKQPNVVFILIDDLSHYGVTAYGANRISSVQGFFKDVEFETPRIDRLAEQGLLVEHAYAYPICEPSRIALMSGKNNIRNYHFRKSQHASDITFGDLFQRAGYETCIVGKWKQTRGTKEIPGEKYIFEFGWDEFSCFDVTTEGKRMIDPDIVENGKKMHYKGIDPITGRRYYGPDIFNRYALDFIERNQEKPFFLYYSMVLVHDEHTPTPDTRPKKVFDEFDITTKTKFGHYTGDDRHFFPDMIAYMDKMIGNVVDQLERLGIADDTVIVVMGDNGTKEAFSHTLADGTVFLGDKGSNKEGGLHVPLILRSSGEIPAGTTYDGLVNLTDILPTICEAADIKHPDPQSLDGISFWKQAIGRNSSVHRDSIYTWFSGNQPSTSSEFVIEYAFSKDFKRYAPDANYPEGRFFDLRTDLFEKSGDRKVEYKQFWNKWHHSGLDLKNLTREQQAAFDELGKVLERKGYTPVQSMQVSKGEAPLRPGDTMELTARVQPTNASRTGVIWESSDPSIATVDKFGVLTAHKAGKVTVNAYSWDDAYPLASNAAKEYSKSGIQDSITIWVGE